MGTTMAGWDLVYVKQRSAYIQEAEEQHEQLINCRNMALSFVMLNQAVFDAFDRRTQELESTARLLASNKPKSHEDLKRSYCKVFELKAHDFMNSDSAKSEAFGPASVIVRCKDPEELLACAKSMDGSLTGTIHAGKEDAALAKKLFPIIESNNFSSWL